MSANGERNVDDASRCTKNAQLIRNRWFVLWVWTYKHATARESQHTDYILSVLVFSMSDATMHRQRHHSSGNNGEVISSNSNNGNWNRGRPTSHEWPRVLQPPQLPPPVAIMRESTPRIHRSRSCGNGSDSDDVKFPYHSPQLPFARSTTSSPNHHNHHPPPSSRGSHHAARSSHLPRENTYSKGINVNNLQPPIRRMSHNNNNQTSSPRSSPVGFGALSLPRPARRSSVCGKSVEDEAISRLRELCMDIVQPSKKGTSPPSRAKIVKEAVVEYHRSRNRPISPRDPNFSAIPSEFSQVLTYGLARSQSVQQSTTFIRGRSSETTTTT